MWPLTVTLDATQTVIHAVPNTNLAASSTYCFYVQGGVQGSNGLAAQTLGYCFFTGTSSADGRDGSGGESGRPVGRMFR